jgi:hypothetical protein
MTSTSSSSSTNAFEHQVKQWIQLDNQIKELNERAKEAREKRQQLEQTLTTYASSNNLSNATLQIGGSKLKFTNARITEPLTFKYLEKTLGQVIRNPTQAKQILDHIKQNRETKIVAEIKRYTNK